MYGAVAFSESNKNVVYVAGENEFLRSSDMGETWDIIERWGPPGIKPGNPIDMVAVSYTHLTLPTIVGV